MEAEIKEAEAEARSWRVEMRVQDPSASRMCGAVGEARKVMLAPGPNMAGIFPRDNPRILG